MGNLPFSTDFTCLVLQFIFMLVLWAEQTCATFPTEGSVGLLNTLSGLKSCPLHGAERTQGNNLFLSILLLLLQLQVPLGGVGGELTINF